MPLLAVRYDLSQEWRAMPGRQAVTADGQPDRVELAEVS